jgi:hypothetical protein
MNHVNAKAVLGLGGVAAIAVIAAIIVSLGRQPASESAQTSTYALPQLRDHINDVKGITLIGAEEKPVVSLIRGDTGWTVKEKGGYPADTGKLRELLLKMADASLLEPKTENDKRYPELGVEDVKSKDAKGILVSLDGLGKPARLIVGNLSGQGSGTFVRRPEDKQSWLAKGNLRIERDPAEWLDKTLADIPSDRIAEIILTRPGGKALRLVKANPSNTLYKVADLPSGRELKDETALNGLASTLAGLTLADVLPEASSPPPGDDKLIKAHYRTFEGLTVDVQAWKQDDKHLARLSATLDQAVADAHIQAEQAKAKADFEAKQKQDNEGAGQGNAEKGAKAPESPPLAVSDPAKDRQQRLDALDQEVKRINQRFGGWRFVIAEYKYANMDKSLEDVLVPAAEKKVAGAKAQTGKSGKR